MQNLSDAVSAFINNYRHTSDALASFIEDAQKSITDISKKHENLFGDLETLSPDVKIIFEKVDGSVELSLEERQEFVRVVSRRGEYIERYPHMLMNMGFIYLVAIFDAFLTDIFTSVLVHRPEALKSKKQLTYERILELVLKEDLIPFMARREITELGYQSMETQAEYYNSKFNIDLSKSGVEINALVEIRERRNLLVHNNGIVNNKYLEKVDSSPFQLGDILNIEYEYWKESRQQLDTVANFVHKSVVDKFIPKDESSSAT